MWNSQGNKTLNGEQGQGSTRDSNFLCSEYNGRADLATDDTNSWGWNHRYGTEEMTSMGDTYGSNWTSDIQGI